MPWRLSILFKSKFRRTSQDVEGVLSCFDLGQEDHCVQGHLRPDHHVHRDRPDHHVLLDRQEVLDEMQSLRQISSIHLCSAYHRRCCLIAWRVLPFVLGWDRHLACRGRGQGQSLQDGRGHLDQVDHHVVLQGHDPVAYFTERKPVKGDSKISYDWDGERYLFASAGNRGKFIADPDRYAPQFSGYCTGTLARGGRAEADPAAWIISDGKLYLFGQMKFKEMAEKDPAWLASRIVAANDHSRAKK